MIITTPTTFTAAADTVTKKGGIFKISSLGYLEYISRQKTEFGSLSYLDMVEMAQLGTTIVSGGYIKSSLLDVDTILTDVLFVGDADFTQTALNNGVTITGGGITMSAGGSVKGGQTGYAVGTGYFLGYSSGAYKFSIGSSSSYIRWDGSSLYIAGNIDTSGYIHATGNINGSAGNSCITGVNSIGHGTAGKSSAGATYVGVFGQGLSGSSGVYAECSSATGSGGAGLSAKSLSASAPAVRAYNSAGGYALRVEGPMQITETDVVTNLNADYLDGYHSTSFSFRVNAAFTNSGTTACVYGTQSGATEAIVGVTTSGNTSAAAHGVRGKNLYRASGGFIGGANNYDFYADGSGTNYGPFTGAHDVLIQNGLTILPGEIVIDLENVCSSSLSNTIFSVVTSSAPNQPAIGVLVHNDIPLADFAPAVFTQDMVTYETVKNDYMLGAVNALGEGQIYVCGEGGDISNGDLIVTSSLPGKGMRQSDNIVRNITVAKSRVPVVFSGPGDIQLIPCIYLCG